MAVSVIVSVERLEDANVLAPERYDPRRGFLAHSEIRLSDIVNFRRDQVNSETANSARKYLVIATGDARDGMIRPTTQPCFGFDVGSMKKRIRPGQVIISRLRPYLRQVALVDEGLSDNDDEVSATVEILCSSEFYVLESKDAASVAFLVPFLLSAQVQSVLAVSQEGGHHPRFNERTLRSLPIPDWLLEQREELGMRVQASVTSARRAYAEMQSCINDANASSSNLPLSPHVSRDG